MGPSAWFRCVLMYLHDTRTPQPKHRAQTRRACRLSAPLELRPLLNMQ